MCKGDVLTRFIDENASRGSNDAENASQSSKENATRCSDAENASQCSDAEKTSFSFVAFVGDGPNDFCPMLKLGPSDLASILIACLTSLVFEWSKHVRFTNGLVFKRHLETGLFVRCSNGLKSCLTR